MLPFVPGVEWQPLAAQVQRVIEALDYLGSPFTADERKAIDAACRRATPEASRRRSTSTVFSA